MASTDRGTSTDAPADQETPTADRADPEESAGAEHVTDVPDGCGCTEIWEHLSERRGD